MTNDCRPRGPVIRDTEGGEMYTFPDSFSLEGRSRSRTTPYVVVGGGDGAVPNDRMSREEPRDIIISGPILDIVDQEAADIRDIEDAILSEIAGKTVWLSRDPDEERMIECRYVSFDHTYEQFWNYEAAQVEITFRADDPFWYDINEYKQPEELEHWIQMPPTLPQTTDFDHEESGDVVTVTNNGNVEALPVVEFEAEEGSVENARITNLATGYNLYYQATMEEGDKVFFNARTYRAIDGEGENVLASVSDDFVLFGFSLEVGANDLEIDWEGEGFLRVRISFRRRWY